MGQTEIEKVVTYFEIGKMNSKKVEKKRFVPSSKNSVASEKSLGTSSSVSPSEGPSSFEEARALDSLEPDYPEVSRRKGEEGTVIVVVFITKEGQVQKVSIEKSSGHLRLDERALAQISQVRFLPSKKDGEAIASQKKIVFEFRLKK